MATRDSQRSKCYAWEVRLPQGRQLPLAECRDLIAKVTQDYAGRGASIPEVVDGRGTRYARVAPTWTGVCIVLPRWARTELTVLHEMAHYLLRGRAMPPGQGSHGPAFVRLTIALWGRYMGQDEKALLAGARAAGLKVARSVPREPLRRNLVAAAVRALGALTETERQAVARQLKGEGAQ